MLFVIAASVGEHQVDLIEKNADKEFLFLFEYLTSKPFMISVVTIIVAALIWIISSRKFNHIVKTKEKRISHKSKETLSFGRKKDKVSFILFGALRFVILLVASLIVLSVHGVSITSIFATLGIATTIIGLSLQDSLKDVFMGIEIKNDCFFELGDVVVYNDMRGVVISQTLRATKIKLWDSKGVITISNHKIDEIIKLVGSTDIDIPLPYEVKPETARDVCIDCALYLQDVPHVKKVRFLGTQKFGDSAIFYRIRIYCDPWFMDNVERSCLGVIQDRLQIHNVEIPYMQIDVHSK